MACLNLAVEEATVGSKTELSEHDIFIRDNITEDDILIVSIGGNDIALKPTTGTVASMIGLNFLTPSFVINRWHTGLGFSHFVNLFAGAVTDYITALTSVCKPKRVLVCMLYYPCQVPSDSWAGPLLGYLGYNCNPSKLQGIIRSLYEAGASKVQVPGLDIVPVPLFEVLDPSDENDYCARVEPSVQGGRKMAKRFVQDMFAVSSEEDVAAGTTETVVQVPSSEEGGTAKVAEL